MSLSEHSGPTIADRIEEMIPGVLVAGGSTREIRPGTNDASRSVSQQLKVT